MTERDAIERRLSAVERAVSDGEADLSALATAAERDERLSEIEARLDALEASVTELEAATQALRGYVGNVRSVNRDVERRAEAALAAVDRLEGTARIEDDDRTGGPASSLERRADESATGNDGGDAGAATGSEERDALRGRGPHSSGPDDGSDPTASPAGSARRAESTVEDLDTGPAMPVPGAENGPHPGGDGNGSEADDRSNGDGVFDRVRDAL